LISSLANLPGIKIEDHLSLFNALVLTDLARRCLTKAGKRKLGELATLDKLLLNVEKLDKKGDKEIKGFVKAALENFQSSVKKIQETKYAEAMQELKKLCSETSKVLEVSRNTKKMDIENFRAVSLLMRMTAFAQGNQILNINQILLFKYHSDSQILF